jgi:myo-inositol 2-dehydrogenase/D-chiro-inositol 1-dehydrogenase
MANLRFGLVGYGAWGKCHAQAIRKTPGCELRAICSHTEKSRLAAAADTGITACANLGDLLARTDLDIIDIVVPNYLHEEIACAALKSGRHVLLEKPMSTSVASCDRILASARRAGRLLLIGHEMRFSAMYIRMRDLVRSGALGDPRYMLIDLWRRPYRPGSDGWRLDPRRVGNWTLEEAVHFFDVISWFLDSLGEPSTIHAQGNRSDVSLPFRANVCDNFTAAIGFPGRAYAVFSQTLAAVEHHQSMKIIGSKAMLRAEWHAELDRSEHPSYFLEISDQGGLKRLEVAATPGELFELQEEIAALARAVRDGAPLPIKPEEGRRAVMLCLEAQRSLETGRVIGLDRAAGKSRRASGKPVRSRLRKRTRA